MNLLGYIFHSINQNANLYPAVCIFMSYYLANKNLPAHLHVYLSLESSNHKKIGEIIKALQIC